jgi:pimeloyl-ACP methyl ester carboxylesterase
MSAVKLSSDSVRLEMDVIRSVYEGKFAADGNTIEGNWLQHGTTTPLVMQRVDKFPEIIRPQTPRKPYPYREEDVAYENPSAKVHIAGTLTVPEGKGPFPAVLLIVGSGPLNRDEEVAFHKPFLVLADHLTRKGIAVLRADKRGVGKTTGDFEEATIYDLADDVRAGAEYLKTRKEIDPKRIGLLGHSEGGLIAPMVANQAPDVAFVVLMAGPGVPGDSVLMLQTYLVARAEGASDSALARGARNERMLLDVVMSEPDTATAAAKLRPLLKEMIAQMTPADSQKANAYEQAAEQQITQVLSPWFRYFISYDPRPTLMKLKQPVLALNGEKDVQVAPKENLAAIEAALKAGGNKDFLVKELPGLNHLFQTANTGGVSEYARIEETISPSALKVIADWILAHTKVRK